MKTITRKSLIFAAVALMVAACKTSGISPREVNTEMPAYANSDGDSTNSANVSYADFFEDPYLSALIDSALANNQELNMTLMEIEMSKNEINAKKGEYLPSVGLGAGGGVDKKGRYTSLGASEATTEIKPGMEMPEPVPDLMIGAYATWEIDIWHKLRNAKEAQVKRYLASIEGKNFMVTNLVAEIANSYYELLALDNELMIIEQNIEIQSNALEVVKIQKSSAKVTELAVKKFQAEVLKTKSLQYNTKQNIVEVENRINFLVGRFPQRVARSTDLFRDMVPKSIDEGVPVQLLENRPDIRQAELELQAAKLDVKSARAAFYPSLGISAGVGVNAFNPTYLIRPESILYNIAGDLAAPLINRRALQTQYANANAKQMQVVYGYEKSILNGYIEVANQVSNIDNLQNSYELKSEQVDTLLESIRISSSLFASARADYMEVLLTQRDALEARFELIEIKLRQMHAVVNMYKALGGGW